MSEVVMRTLTRAAVLAAAAGLSLAASVAAPVAAADPPGHRITPTSHLSVPPSRAASSALPGTRTPQAFPGTNGKVVFERSPANDWPSHLWLLDTTSALAELTTYSTGIGDRFPAYSPGGTLITFTRDQTTSETDNAFDVYVMKADGTGTKRLTTAANADYDSSFSPDGSRLVFTSLRNSGQADLYSMKIDGSDVKRLTTNIGYDAEASYSPDGKKIVFVSDRAGNDEIYSMNVDGTGVKRLTTNLADDFWPDWSPDGALIEFTTDRNAFWDLYTINADGTGAVNRTPTFDFDVGYGVFTPDGMAFRFHFTGPDDLDLGFKGIDADAGGTGLQLTGTDEGLPNEQPIPAFPLVDARFSTFDADIQWVFNEGITVGCSAERYCPDDVVTRGQMATFLVRALDLPPTATDYFTDDDGTTHEQNINRVAAAGITSGCAPTKYCPNDPVLRGAMASFLARAFDLPATPTDYFTDDDGTTHEQNINRVKEAGITSGCTPTTYCPDSSVTRGQMAAFLRRALS
jgi:hypothetical protein